MSGARILLVEDEEVLCDLINRNLEAQLDTIALAFVRVFSSWGVRECAILLPDKDGTLTVRVDAPIRVESFTFSTFLDQAVRVIKQARRRA